MSGGSLQVAGGAPVAVARFADGSSPPQARAASAAGDGRAAKRRANPASGAGSAALAIENVSISFGGVAALCDVDLEVAPSAIHAIIGPNGAGKSSLINVVSGLYRADQGYVWLAGKRYAHVPTERLAHLGVARTFQNLALFKGLSVTDNVAAGLVHTHRAGVFAQILGTPRARREETASLEKADEIIRFFDLHPYRDRAAGTLPYGIQKRIELARALVTRPHLLLLDEPMAGMTATDKRGLAQHIRAARDQFGTTIVLIEHDIGVVMGLSDRVAVLDYGRKIADGTPDEIKSDPVVIDAYLGVAHDLEAGAGI